MYNSIMMIVLKMDENIGKIDRKMGKNIYEISKIIYEGKC